MLVQDEELGKGVVSNLGGSACDLTDPLGKLLLGASRILAKFQFDLIWKQI